MPLPMWDISVTSAPIPPANAVAEVVVVPGPPGAGTGTGTVGNLYEGRSFDGPLAAALGTDGYVRDEVRGLLAQVGPTVVYSPTVASPTAEQIVAAVNLAINSGSHTPTLILLPGTLGNNSSTAADSALTTIAGNTVAGRDDLLARVIVNAPKLSGRDTIAQRRADAVTFAGHNAHPRSITVFNGASGKWPAGYWLGAALREASNSRFGRARGIQLAPVRGIGTLEFNLLLGSPDLTALDTAGVTSIINTSQGPAIAGGNFGYTSTTDPQRDWSIARVTDHAGQLLHDAWLALQRDHYSPEILAGKLTTALAPIIGTEVVGATVTMVQQAQGNYTVDMTLNYSQALTGLTVRLHLVASAEGLS